MPPPAPSAPPWSNFQGGLKHEPSGDKESSPMSKALVDPNKPTIPLGRALERVNRDGGRYIVLNLGPAKLLLFDTAESEGDQRVWEVYMGEDRGIARAAGQSPRLPAAEDKPNGTAPTPNGTTTASTRK